MAVRQWMVTHEWMVNYTPQTEWIEKRGLLVWLAEVFTTLGTGLYLVSLIYNNIWGMLFGWSIIVVLKTVPHVIYLGRPFRFWRMLPPFTKTWRTSWIARGLFFTVVFIGLAFIQLILTFLAPESGWETTFKILSGIAVIPAAIYSGFALSYCRSVPLWNSVLLPALLFIAGITDGLALTMAIGWFTGLTNIAAIEPVTRIFLILNAIFMASYLIKSFRCNATARHSTLLLLKGSLALPFWAGIVSFGIIIPLLFSFITLIYEGYFIPFLLIVAVLHTISAFSLKYCLLKAGIHRPLFPLKDPDITG